MSRWLPSASHRSVAGIEISVTSYIRDDYSWTIFCRLGGFDVMATGRGFTTLEEAQHSADAACRKLISVGVGARIDGTA